MCRVRFEREQTLFPQLPVLCSSKQSLPTNHIPRFSRCHRFTQSCPLCYSFFHLPVLHSILSGSIKFAISFFHITCLGNFKSIFLIANVISIKISTLHTKFVDDNLIGLLKKSVTSCLIFICVYWRF